MKILSAVALSALVLSASTALLTGCASSTSPSTTTQTVTPPVVTAITPTSAPVGAAAVTLTVTGTGFTSSSVVQVAGVNQSTTYVSTTQLTATIPAALLSSAATLPVAVLNGSTTSATGTPLTIEIDNPAPAVASFSPTSLSAGLSSSVTIAGTGFVPTSSAQIGGGSRATTYVSPTQVIVSLTAADVAAAGSLSLKIVNPAPGGGTSATASIPVNNGIPTGLALNPATTTVGSAATTVTVAGIGFVSGSVVNVNGSPRSTTTVDSTHLTFTLTAADQNLSAQLAISVTNPAPGGGTSTAVPLTITAAATNPGISGISPNQIIVGSPDTGINVLGTGFSARSVVQMNGSPLATSYVIGTTPRLFATLPAASLTSLGSVSITVNNAGAPQPISNAVSVSIVTPPAPTLTSISPNSAPLSTATKITLFGTNFAPTSTVSYNGTALTTTYSSSTSLTAQIPASLLALPGNGSVTVTTPAPGGGTTSAQTFTAYIGIVNNSMVYNPANGLLYVSVPSAAGPAYGNSVVTVDPATGVIGTPIVVGSEPNRLALSSDGKILWVGLDGGNAVRQVDLTTNTPGLQFSLNGNAGIYASPYTATALAALPGSPNSVAVASSGGGVAIYDNGVRRGTPPTNNYSYNSVAALQVDGSKSEIYAGAGSTYYVYTYNSSGTTLKTTATTGTYTNYTDDMQLAGGRIYATSGHVYDVESGALLGTFYNTGTTVASGPIVADTGLNKAFVLDYNNIGYGYNQIQTFNTGDFTSASSSVIQVNGISSTYTGSTGNPSHLLRWGTNGLAFRASNGIFSIKSNLVKDLSSTNADLGITIATAGATTTGGDTTYTATIANAGPSSATNVVLSALPPSSGLFISATPSQGTCSSGTNITCNLGGIASNASATVAIAIRQTTAGNATLTALVSGSEADPSSANNQATASVTVTGNGYNVAPTIASLSPSAVLAGSSDATITVNGTGFTSATVALWNGSPVSTSVTSTNQLTAVIPSSALTTLGWGTISVSTPTPGGGTSTVLPLSIYNVLTLGVNHILYDPFSRKIYASVGSGSSTVTGNSIAAITPETGSIGTPVSIGSQPTALALSSNGQMLYTILGGSSSIARFNMLTQQADFTYTPTGISYSSYTTTPRGIAVQPGTEDTVAVDLSAWAGNALYDFNPATKTAAMRGQASGPYTGTSLHFLDATNLFAVDNDTSGGTFDHYTVTSAGFTYYNYSQYTTSTLNHFGAFKINGGLAFANAGGVANPSTTPATQLGYFGPINSNNYTYYQVVEPDTSLSRVFFLGNTSASTNYSSSVDGIIAYNQNTFLPSSVVSLNMAATEGNNTSFTAVDLIRWGQDGLAALTSGGHIYIMRGPVVVPQLLNQNSAATLSTASPSSITHGAGNTLLTITGSGFVQGAAVNWNGSYRTTTWVDSSHLTVAIPFSDLASAGSATLVVTNPGASASNSITFTIN